MNFDLQVQQALQQARAGQTNLARQTLTQVLKGDPANMRAWYLLSFLVHTPQSKAYCLEMLLRYHPGNRAAQTRLERIHSSAADHHPVPVKSSAAQPRSKSRIWPWLLSFTFMGFVVVFGAAFLWQAAPSLERILGGAVLAASEPPAAQAAASDPLDLLPSLTPFQPLAPTATALPSLTPSPTVTITPSPTPTLTPTPSPTITPTPTETATIAPILNPPAQAYITGIIGSTQKMPLSCEASSATDWAAYFSVFIDEFVFQNQLPLSDNPDKGFVGSVMGSWGQIPPNPYGVHAGPVATLLQTYGLRAEAVHAFSLSGLKQEIAAGRPVIVWITGAVEPGTAATYIDSQGETSIVAPFEHTVIVIGYTEDTITVLDGGAVYQRSISIFMQSWQVLGFQGIILRP
jgi:uncharacterized protein YvpB